MLDLHQYNRQELIAIFKTERIDSIEAKLKRYGYKFQKQGRGKTYTLTITECPYRFREFCIEKLGFAPQTDFKKLKAYLSNFILDKQFRRLTFVEMERELKKDTYVSAQTIGRWTKHLFNENIIGYGDWIYYSIDTTKKCKSKEITKKEYNTAWKIYYDNIDFDYCDRYGMMCWSIGGYPFKKEEILLNAIESERIDELEKILKQENENNDN